MTFKHYKVWQWKYKSIIYASRLLLSNYDIIYQYEMKNRNTPPALYDIFCFLKHKIGISLECLIWHVQKVQVLDDIFRQCVNGLFPMHNLSFSYSLEGNHTYTRQFEVNHIGKSCSSPKKCFWLTFYSIRYMYTNVIVSQHFWQY